MRAQILLFTTLLRALVVYNFLLLVLRDVSRSLWVNRAGLAFTGVLLLAPRGRRASRGGHPPDAPTDSPSAALSLRSESAGGEDPTPSPTPPPPPR